ncbi:MAG: 23S rRNA (guanosine2251-2'-O)-methyltransferase [Sphingobacteriales bacterium]|jgi:23S rRNA (guanosine2251-2'-O)-methyltransferase
MENERKKLQLEELGRMDENHFKEASKIPVVIVLDNVRSGHNVGSFFRTADAFRLSEIHLCGYTPIPPNKEIRKTALGATETVKWTQFESTQISVELLKSQGYQIYSLEQTSSSISLEAFSFPEDGKLAFVFGNEVRGVEQAIIDFSDGCIEIEQLGTKHSLNVSICGGIVLWDAFKAYRKNL